MRSIWQKMKEIWWEYWEVEENDKTKESLSSLDKRWLLYWNFITCMGIALFFLLVTEIVNIRVTRQNGKNVEDAMSMIATYMASATRDEYDNIAQSIRHDLVFSEYGEDIENFIQYIPNTAETCPTCMESYLSQALLVCTNTGQFYSLDLYNKEEDPNGQGSILNFGYDEVSQTSLSVSKSPEQKVGYAKLNCGRGIVSVHRMKTLFCDSCIQNILNTVKYQATGEFVIYDTEKRKFYPMNDDTTVQIGDYSLEIEYKNSNYKIIINSMSE